MPSSSPLSDAAPEAHPLHDALATEDATVRSAAFDELIADDPPDITRSVAAAALADADAGIREEAARWLTEHRTPAVAAKVAPQIGSDNITTRNLAGEVLADMGACAIQALVAFVDDPDHDVRKFALDVLAQIPEAVSVTDVIAERLEDDDANVRLAAVAALGALGAAEHGDELRALYDADPLARPDVVTAMGAFGAKGDFALLERALSDDNPVVQLSAAEALASQDGPGVLERLLRQVERVNPMARPIVLNSIIERCERLPAAAVDLPDTLEPHLQEMLADPSSAYRCAAARGLRFFSTEQTVESMLAHAGEDDDLDVELFQTLTRHPNPFAPVHRATSANRMDPGAAATFTLGLLAQEAIPPDAFTRAGSFLQRHFDRLSADDKMTAIGLCEQLGRPELQPVIEAAQSDPDPSIRAFADDLAVPHL